MDWADDIEKLTAVVIVYFHASIVDSIARMDSVVVFVSRLASGDMGGFDLLAGRVWRDSVV